MSESGNDEEMLMRPISRPSRQRGNVEALHHYDDIKLIKSRQKTLGALTILAIVILFVSALVNVLLLRDYKALRKHEYQDSQWKNAQLYSLRQEAQHQKESLNARVTELNSTFTQKAAGLEIRHKKDVVARELVEKSLKDELQERTTAINDLKKSLEDELQKRTIAINNLNESLAGEIQERRDADSKQNDALDERVAALNDTFIVKAAELQEATENQTKTLVALEGKLTQADKIQKDDLNRTIDKVHNETHQLELRIDGLVSAAMVTENKTINLEKAIKDVRNSTEKNLILLGEKQRHIFSNISEIFEVLKRVKFNISLLEDIAMDFDSEANILEIPQDGNSNETTIPAEIDSAITAFANVSSFQEDGSGYTPSPDYTSSWPDYNDD